MFTPFIQNEAYPCIIICGNKMLVCGRRKNRTRCVSCIVYPFELRPDRYATPIDRVWVAGIGGPVEELVIRNLHTELCELFEFLYSVLQCCVV